MKSSDSNNWLIPLLAAFAIYVPLSTTSSSPDQQSSAQPQSPALIQMVSLATPAPAPTPGPGRVSGEAAKLLCDFFGAKPDLDQDAHGRNSGQKQAQPNAPQDFDPKNLRGDYCRVKSIRDLNKIDDMAPAEYKIEYLIATVPDPKDSRLDYMFDRYLDVIQLAIGEAGYTFDHYWLPWDRSRTAAPVGLPADPKSPQMAMATRYLYDPGVILFRGDKRVLLLFLVGETPTGGIHKVAFQNALWQIEELAGWRESKAKEAAEKELRIISPSFSGSADSLATLLKTWINGYETPPKVRIVSGSATSINKNDLLDKIGWEGVSFQTTVLNVQEANDKLYAYLRDIDPQSRRVDDGPHIALLSEASTGHGQSVRAELQGPILSLTFPLHISQLRVEAARQSPSRDEAAKALAAKDFDLALPMSEAGSPASKDIVPLFSPVETVTMKLALDEALSAIHRERIRYVGVTATDVQDRIFLVREIRKHCPNAMIFIQTDDLLYLHPESNLDFQGALVASTYPLFGLNQLWTYPFAGGKSRLQFSTYTAQGMYNATLALLDKKDLMLEYGSPFYKYKDGETRYPALWLGVIGRNGIWPVKTFDLKIPPDENGYTLSVSTKSSSSGVGENAEPQLGLSGNYWSPTGIGILLLIGGICLFLPLVFLTQSILFWGRSKVDKGRPDQWREGRSKLSRAIIGRILELEREIEEGNVRTWLRPFAWVRRGWTGQVFGDEEFYCYRLDRRINLACCCVSLVIVTLFISSVAMLPAWIRWEMTKGEPFKTRWDQDLAFGAIAGTILVFALAAFFWLAASIFGWMISGWRHFRGHIGALLALGVGAAMITFVALGLLEIFRVKPAELLEKIPEQIFFFLRSTELSSGVSILLPGLLIGLAIFLSFFAALRRLNLAERMPCLREPQQRPGDAPQFLRFDHEQAESFKGLKVLEDRVKEMIVCRIIEVPGAALAVFVIFILYWRLFLQRFIPSVDGWAFDLFFKLGLYIAPLLLAWSFLRFTWLWAALRRLLRRLSWHPLISQYAAEHSEEKRFASLPPVDLMTPTPTYTALSASARQARSFYGALKLPPELAGTGQRIGRLVEEAESKLSLALHFDAQGAWQEALRNRRGAQAALAELAEPVSALLEDSWRTSDGAPPDAGWRDEGKFFLITQIVAFLQHIFAHLQNLAALVTIGLLLLLVAANSYPFRPREPLLLFSWVAILTSVVVTLFIFVQVSRDKTLSLLTGKTPGRLNITRDFVMRVLIHGVVPIIALLGAQFPQAVRQIFSWLSVFEGKGS
jgi:hypothetical protein